MIYNEDVINAVKDILVRQQKTIAVAESVTSGHLQAAFSVGIEASKYFQGGITVYNIGQKTRHLGIDPIHANRVNCVSEKVAHTMAIEVSKMFLSDYGVGITGYSSVVPECEKEGIYAFFSIIHKSDTLLEGRITSSANKPHDVQIDYTKQVIDKFYQFLQLNK